MLRFNLLHQPCEFKTKDGTRYHIDRKGYWKQLGYERGFTTAHTIEFAEALEEATAWPKTETSNK